ncbi:MAG: SRPBCC family protein [Nitrososphaerales archaeon]
MPARSTKAGESADFAYFEDKGSVYDAPIDVVWDFMNDGEFHPQAHAGSLRNMRWKEVNEITGEATCEVVRGGRWIKMKARITTVPPLVRISEEFEGAYAGSKMVFLYTPKGNKTGIDVYVRAPKAVADELRETLAKAFREDVPMLRAFARKRRQG